MLLRVQHADAERRQHLVERKRQVVGVKVPHVDERPRHQLRAVDEQAGTPLAGGLRVTAGAASARMTGSGFLVPRKFEAPVQHTSLVRASISDARWSRSSSPVTGSNRASRYSIRRPNLGRISRHIAYQGT